MFLLNIKEKMGIILVYKAMNPVSGLRNSVITLLLIIKLTGCSSLDIMQTEAGILADEMSIVTAGEKNWEELGNTLAFRIEQTTIDERPNIRSANSRLALSGGIVTFIGVVSAGVIGTTSNNNIKTGAGLSATILTSLVGIYQIWTGTKKDAAEYVRASGKVISDWKIGIVSANNNDMRKEAYISFLKDIANLQSEYPGFATFSVSDMP